jgi:hypothetical protein
VLQRVKARRRGKHPALEGFTRGRAWPSRLGPRLRVYLQIHDRIGDRLIWRRPFAGADGEDEALPTYRLTDPCFEPQCFGRHLVQRLQHRDVVALAPDDGFYRLLSHPGFGRQGRRNLLFGQRRRRVCGRRGDSGRRRFFRGRRGGCRWRGWRLGHWGRRLGRNHGRERRPGQKAKAKSARGP